MHVSGDGGQSVKVTVMVTVMKRVMKAVMKATIVTASFTDRDSGSGFGFSTTCK